MLYSTFRGNKATRYGLAKEEEEETIQQYLTHQKSNGHPDLSIEACRLFVSLSNPWLVASPDGSVQDLSNTKHPLGLLLFSVREKTLTEACSSSSFCLEERQGLTQA